MVKFVILPPLPGGPPATVPKEIPHSLRKDLAEALSRTDAPCSFAVGESANNQMNPGLRIKDIGEVGLPLSTRDAMAITRSAHLGPFANDTTSAVHNSNRCTWEILGENVKITNPVWPAFLQSVVARVCNSLRIYPGGKEVKAVLHKLQLYGKGAVFVSHQE